MVRSRFPSPSRPSSPVISVTIAIIGEKYVGKTSISNRFVYGKYQSSRQLTMVIQILRKSDYMLNGTRVDVKLRDISGEDTIGVSDKVLYQTSTAAILVVDINEKDSLVNAVKWKDSLDANTPRALPCILFANKTDLCTSPVSADELDAFCKGNKILKWFATSALDGTNIMEGMKYAIECSINTINEDSFHTQLLKKNRGLGSSYTLCNVRLVGSSLQYYDTSAHGCIELNNIICEVCPKTPSGFRFAFWLGPQSNPRKHMIVLDDEMAGREWVRAIQDTQTEPQEETQATKREGIMWKKTLCCLKPFLFVLEGKTLKYYQQGCLDLTGAKIRIPAPIEKLQFSIQGPQIEGRRYIFQAGSESKRREWIDKLQKASIT